MTNVAAYVRYSSDNQRDESLDAQIRAIQAYAKSNDMSVVRIYSDKAKSATTDKRTEFQNMIKDSSLGLFQAVVVHKLDRFSRDKYDNVLYKRKLKKYGIRVLSVTENLDGSPESVILESLLEGMAEYYSKNLAREVMKGMRENAYNCKHTGGIPPLGYDITPDKDYVINEEEAEIVKDIFSLYLAGHGYKRIINHMNTQGYKTKRGNAFGKNSLHDILANEKYSGTYIFNRTASKDAFGLRNGHSRKSEEEIIRIEDGIPAIISKKDYALVKAKMLKNKHQPGLYKAKQLYLLSGIISCGECNQTMQGNARTVGRNKQRYISYRCGNRDRNNTCNNKELRKEYIEHFVLSELEKKLLNEDAIPLLIKRLNDHLVSANTGRQEEIHKMKKRLQEVDKQLINMVDAVSQGFAQESFKEKVTSLDQEKAEIKIRLAELSINEPSSVLAEGSIRKLFASFKQFVAERNIPECKKFIENYVEKVTVYKERVEVKFKFNVGSDGEISVPVSKSSSAKKSLFKKYK